jgi:hypothetical protein
MTSIWVLPLRLETQVSRFTSIYKETRENVVLCSLIYEEITFQEMGFEVLTLTGKTSSGIWHLVVW